MNLLGIGHVLVKWLHTLGDSEVKPPESSTNKTDGLSLSPMIDRPWAFRTAVALAFTVIFGMAFLTVYYHHKDATDHTRRANSEWGSLLSNVIWEHQNGVMGVVEAYATRPLLVIGVEQRDSNRLLSHLEAFKTIHDLDADGVFVTDGKGDVLASYPASLHLNGQSLSASDWYEMLTSGWKPYISESFRPAGHDDPHAIMVCKPIRNPRDEVIGVLGSIQFTEHLGKLVGKAPSDPARDLTIVDRQGQIIYTTKHKTKDPLSVQPWFRDLKNAPPGETHTMTTPDTRNDFHETYVTMAPIEETGWSIILEKRKADVFRSQYTFFGGTMIAAFLTFSLLLLLLVYVRKHFAYQRMEEKTRSQAELRESETRYSSLLHNITLAVVGLDPKGTVTFVNPFASQVAEYAPEEMVGKSWFAEFVTPPARAGVEAAYHEFLATESSGYGEEYPIVTKSGTVRILAWTTTALKGTTGNVTGTIQIGKDITERKTLQAQLVQAQKLESIGQLAAGIAHEINTPTQYVGDNIHFLDEAFAGMITLTGKYKELLDAARAGEVTKGIIDEVEKSIEKTDIAYLREEIPKAIRQSMEGVERVTGIVRAMKEFSHPGTKEKELIDINKAIENTLTVSRNEWKYVADAITDFDPSLPPVPCLPGEFNQVILNIIINAAQAIAEKNGTSARKGNIRVSTCRQNGWAEIRISDTGVGIPEEIRARVFDPFFTTKEVGKGTGQGLAIARSIIVDKHGGSITFDAVPGEGTAFLLRLPMEKEGER